MSHEIENRASLPNSTHIPYSRLQEFVTFKKEEIKNKNIVFYCAIGERSALAIQVCIGYKIKNVYHLVGGINNI